MQPAWFLMFFLASVPSAPVHTEFADQGAVFTKGEAYSSREACEAATAKLFSDPKAMGVNPKGLSDGLGAICVQGVFFISPQAQR